MSDDQGGIESRPGDNKESLWSLFRNHTGRPIHKWTQYFPVYERHFGRYVGKKPLMIEIGCGQGGSLEMWQRYFGEGCRIVGVDIRPECREFAKPGIAIEVGDQSDHAFLQSLLTKYGTPDIVLDDGSHVMRHINATFDFLYDRTSTNGIYLVEDLHTAYWEAFGGGLRRPGSFIERAKGLIDSLNVDYLGGQIAPSAFSRVTSSIHFYDSMIAFERTPTVRKEALEIGGPDNAVRNTTQILRNLGPKPAALAAPVSQEAFPIHIHLAAMAPQFLDVRTHLPLRQLKEVPGVTVSMSDRKIVYPRLPLEAAKVIVLQRPLLPDEPAWRSAWADLEAKGWVVVTELDDHPDLVGEVLGPSVGEGLHRALRMVHAVQTSTEPLAEALRAFNPEVAVFRNAAFSTVEAARAPDSHGRMRVFYGALNRERFSAQVGAALAPYAAAHPEIEFVVVRDRAFFDALGDATKTFHTAKPYADYLELMRGCDVALMPLEGAPGERFKSDLKFIEASSLGLASIASPVVYGGTIRDRDTGLIAAAVQQWPKALAELHRDPGLRFNLAQAALRDVRDHRTFASQIESRLSWYRGLWFNRSRYYADSRRRFDSRN